jgi:hypothetical protein
MREQLSSWKEVGAPSWNVDRCATLDTSTNRSTIPRCRGEDRQSIKQGKDETRKDPGGVEGCS